MKIDLALRKPNVTLVMTPKAGKLTAIERKLLNSMLLSSSHQLKTYKDTYGTEPDNKYLYSALADELLDPIEVGKSNLKSALRKHVLALRRAEMDWEAPDAKSGIVWSNMSVLSQANFEIRNGCLYVLWALPPDLNAALSDSQYFPFTKLDLVKISSLKSYAAVALYEICARYRNNYLKGGDGECLTSSNAPEWWVDALTNITPKIDKNSGLPIRREWRKVKSETVNKAIEEINEKTDLILKLEEKKTGKAITSVQFIVRQRKPEPREIQSSHFPLLKTGMRLGLSELQIQTAIIQTSVEKVELSLAKLEARVARKDLASLDNVARYFASIVNDGDQVKLVDDKLDVKPSLELRPQDQGLPLPKSEATLLKERFMALLDTQKRAYAEMAIEELKRKGLASKRIIGHAEEGVWSGILLYQMIDCFGRESAEGISTC